MPGSAASAVRCAPILCVSVCLLFTTAVSADSVTWSNGRTQEGKLELGDPATVRLHDGTRVRSWGLNEIAEITFFPATQKMERAWVFKEAGKTAKVFSGEPYPTMELRATVALRNGGTANGHLLTTAFDLTTGNHTEKLVLKYKLRGQAGQTETDIVYVARLQVGAVHSEAKDGGLVSVLVAGIGSQAELALVSRARMQAADIRRTGTNTFQVVLDGENIVPAVRTGNRIAVGWGGNVTPAARGRIAQGLRDLRDFFDDRRLLGISQDPNDETTCHTLLLLTRVAKTTMEGPNTQPWRLEIWKWRLGSETNDITAAARCVLFRGIRAPDSPLPEVDLGSGLCPYEHLSDGLILKP